MSYVVRKNNHLNISINNDLLQLKYFLCNATLRLTSKRDGQSAIIILQERVARVLYEYVIFKLSHKASVFFLTITFCLQATSVTLPESAENIDGVHFQR